MKILRKLLILVGLSLVLTGCTVYTCEPVETVRIVQYERCYPGNAVFIYRSGPVYHRGYWHR